MKNKVLTLATLLLLLFSNVSRAQTEQIANFLAGSVNDAEKLFGAYISPYANAIGADLSTGWYTTAKVHKLGGFDIMVGLNLAIIPTSDQTFNINDLNLEGIPGTTLTLSQNTSPTAAGGDDVANIAYTMDDPLNPGNTINLFDFDLPGGTNFRYTPAPMIQAGIGLVKGIEITGRYCPNLDIGSIGSIGLWGAGLKLGVSEWIPVIEKIPVLHFSLQGGYTKLNAVTDLSMTPDIYGITSYNAADYANQQMTLGISSLTANLVVSADVSIVSVYGAVGFSRTSTELALEGNYPLPSVDLVTGDLTYTNANDPVNITITNEDGSYTKPRYNVGARLKLAVIVISFDYTYAEYSLASVGLGVTFR